MKIVSTLLTTAIVAALAPIAAAQQTGQAEENQWTRDQLHAAVQEICPVSGQKLGTMGDPIKVKIGEEQVLLCCKGCLKGKVKPEHWATIHQNFAKAQGTCPVMGRPLPENPKWTIVDGQIFYVCCPPCTEKIEAAPEKYLKELDKLYSASLNAKQEAEKR